MTTFIHSDLEPVARLRSAIPETCQPMLDVCPVCAGDEGSTIDTERFSAGLPCMRRG